MACWSSRCARRGERPAVRAASGGGATTTRCRPDVGGIWILAARGGGPPVRAAARVLPHLRGGRRSRPWCDVTTARFTTRFEEAVGFLVQRCDKTSVQEMFNVAWVTVGQIVERVRHRHRPDDPLEGLMAIGVDELSYRKGHKYVTTVTDQLSGQIVWAAEGKNAATLQSFFDALGPERCAAIAVVTMDMSEDLYHRRATDGLAGADCLRPFSCAEAGQRGAGRDTARGMATPAGHGCGGGHDG